MPRRASGGAQTYVIAEAGVNHNGSIDLALQLVDAAAGAGANAVKFQTFRASQLTTAVAPKAAYQTERTDIRESQQQMLRRLELRPADHRALLARCRRVGIQFMSSPFDAASLTLLTRTLRLPVLKIPSGEITNGPLLLKAGRSGRRIILSTGMSVLAEIEAALEVIAFGLLGSREAPSRASFARAYDCAAGQRRLREKVVVLHCVTDYPARFEDTNLRAMDTLRMAFGLPVGMSDHTPGIAVPIAAVARGACVIEKHLTLDRDLPGPDHRASLEPQEFASMVRAIRQVESALGDGLKRPTAAESANLSIARKSLVAARDIRAGERYTAENLAAKRAGGGRSAIGYWELLGRRATRRYVRDEPIE